MTTLIACSHGTNDAAGRMAIRSIVDGIRRSRPALSVHEAFVDVQGPDLGEVVSLLDPDGDAIIVPLLLSTGYHVRVDIARAAGAAASQVGVAASLGPHPVLAEILVERLVQAGATPADHVVLAAAGSSDPRAADDVERLATMLRASWPGAVTIGYGASATPSVPAAVDAARATGDGRVVIASYLLAPGYFHDRLLEAGADLVSAPLAPDPRLVELAIDRYRSARLPLTGTHRPAGIGAR